MIQKHPATVSKLASNADVVHKKCFEAAVLKVQLGNRGIFLREERSSLAKVSLDEVGALFSSV